MTGTHQHHQAVTYCIMDRKAIPTERAERRSNTCCKECASALRKLRRAQADLKRCRICGKPSTIEERKLYQQWRRANPQVGGARREKRGRPPAQKAEAATA